VSDELQRAADELHRRPTSRGQWPLDGAAALQFAPQLDGSAATPTWAAAAGKVRSPAPGDFDADGKPDLLFSIGGASASHRALVLSWLAKPGRNPPTAYLTATGC
jgi:hypothetical protein